MRLKSFLAAISLVFLCSIVLLQSAYAEDRHGRGHDGSRYYRHERFYPRDYFFYRKLFCYPENRFYYYYDVYPEKRYYYSEEKDIYPTNPDYLPLTSIANMGSQGVPDIVIIDEIKRTRSTYKLNSEIITYLRQNGVTDRVIDFMLKPENK